MTLEIKSYNLIITGVGGQGNVLSSQLIGEAFINHGFYVTIGETYGSSQRGGAVMGHIRVRKDKQPSTLIPKGKADLILALEPIEAIRVLTQYGNVNTATISNIRPYYPVDVNAGEDVYPEMRLVKQTIEALSEEVFYMDATGLAVKMGNPILTNMIMIGAFVEFFQSSSISENIKEILVKRFEAKRLELNLKAFEAGKKLLRNEETEDNFISLTKSV
jgi:indolepyruvate ferredoxin oxidoreductase beta subunit